MKLEILGYEITINKMESGLRFVTEEELIKREKRVEKEIKKMFLKQGQR